jgi:lipoyl(octanoyl) transferase
VTRRTWLFEPAGAVPYAGANHAMHDLAARRLDEEIPDSLILLEHSPVFTAGRRAKPEHLVWSEQEAVAHGAEVHHIDRGGSFTFHGPGQLVGYPILRLAEPIDVVGYVRRLEGILIDVLTELGVEGRRVEGRSGVWVGPPGAENKIAAIGIRVADGVTMHGFALNCSNSLEPYEKIVACGIRDAGITTISRELGYDTTPEDLVEPITQRFLAEAAVAA